MARPIWEGHLRLSLVSSPVALFNATTRAHDVSFNLIHHKTHSRVRMIPHDPELGEVERKDLVRGFEISKDRYVVLTDEEIKSVRLPSTKSIDIEEFVDAGEIDRIFWDNPYYLVPSGKVGMDAYVIIREAMEQNKKLALGRLVLHNRERIVALEPRGKGMQLTTLRSHDEVRDESEFFDSIPAGKADKRMLEIAEKIIEQQTGKFDSKKFKDRYEDALRDLIKSKMKHHKPVAAPAPEKEEKVVDLMEALKRSLEGGKDSSGRARRFMAARGAKAEAKPRRAAAHRTEKRRRAR